MSLIDKVQVFGILCLIATEDHDLDRAILRDFLFNVDYDKIGSHCMDMFVELEGMEGLLLCVRQFHSKLAQLRGFAV